MEFLPVMNAKIHNSKECGFLLTESVKMRYNSEADFLILFDTTQGEDCWSCNRALYE